MLEKTALRARSATQVENSTLKGVDGKLNAVSAEPVPTASPGGCSLDDPTCEACQ